MFFPDQSLRVDTQSRFDMLSEFIVIRFTIKQKEKNPEEKSKD